MQYERYKYELTVWLYILNIVFWAQFLMRCQIQQSTGTSAIKLIK